MSATDEELHFVNDVLEMDHVTYIMIMFRYVLLVHSCANASDPAFQPGVPDLRPYRVSDSPVGNKRPERDFCVFERRRNRTRSYDQVVLSRS